ncbi:MAG: DUF6719 family protein [Roseiarcus sp.]|jgi:hypothetical protein
MKLPAPGVWTVRSLVGAACWLIASSASWAQTGVLTQEPPAGGLKSGEIVYVDDGHCPKGKVKQVVGADTMSGHRTRCCVARPN